MHKHTHTNTHTHTHTHTFTHTHTHTHTYTHAHRPVVHIKLINNGPEPRLDIVMEASGQRCSSLLMSL